MVFQSACGNLGLFLGGSWKFAPVLSRPEFISDDHIFCLFILKSSIEMESNFRTDNFVVFIVLRKITLRFAAILLFIPDVAHGNLQPSLHILGTLPHSHFARLTLVNANLPSPRAESHLFILTYEDSWKSPNLEKLSVVADVVIVSLEILSPGSQSRSRT